MIQNDHCDEAYKAGWSNLKYGEFAQALDLGKAMAGKLGLEFGSF